MLPSMTLVKNTIYHISFLYSTAKGEIAIQNFLPYIYNMARIILRIFPAVQTAVYRTP